MILVCFSFYFVFRLFFLRKIFIFLWCTNLYVHIYVFRKIQSKKVSVNIYGPKSTIASSKAVGGPFKNIVEQIPPKLITENVGDVTTKEKKLVSYWKK